MLRKCHCYKSAHFRFVLLAVCAIIIVQQFLVGPCTNQDQDHTSTKSISDFSTTATTTLKEQELEAILMVMGERSAMHDCYGMVRSIKGFPIHFVYGSYNEAFSIKCDIDCDFLYLKDTTWTEGRNLLAEKAVEIEMSRGREFDYWIFADDDFAPECTEGSQLIHRPGSCWRQFFYFLASDPVVRNPKITSITTVGDRKISKLPYQSTSNTDPMLAVFKRSYVPYLMPYATLQKSFREWMSVAALFCLMEIYFKQSQLLVPLIISTNPLHRNYTRGMNGDQLHSAIVSNFHDASEAFYPCADMYKVQNHYSDLISLPELGTVEEILDAIPDPQLDLCSPLLKRFANFSASITQTHK